MSNPATEVFLATRRIFPVLMKVTSPIIRLPFLLFDQKLIEIFRLAKCSASWRHLHWIYRLVMFFAWGSCVTLLAVLLMFPFIENPPTNATFIKFVSAAFALISGFLYNLLYLLKTCSENPEIQRGLAGVKAESYVKKQLDGFAANVSSCVALHGTLLVFNHGQPNEYSAELDHLIITKQRVFLIETKYKSGTILAKADATNWTVSSSGRESTMRNALLQAKNSVAVLEREISLEPVVPIVAIYGENVSILEGPTNVVEASRLMEVIDAFYVHNESGAVFDPEAIKSKIAVLTHTDKPSMDRHILRAAAAREKAAAAKTVDMASM